MNLFESFGVVALLPSNSLYFLFYAGQSRLLVEDCAAKLEAFGLHGAIQEVSMIKVRAERGLRCSRGVVGNVVLRMHNGMHLVKGLTSALSTISGKSHIVTAGNSSRAAKQDFETQRMKSGSFLRLSQAHIESCF